MASEHPPPDRIWAVVRGGGMALLSGSPYVMGSFESRPDDKATEYVRSDLVKDMERELQMLRNIVQGEASNDH